jgi:hypothetical protein
MNVAAFTIVPVQFTAGTKSFGRNEFMVRELRELQKFNRTHPTYIYRKDLNADEQQP